MKKKVMACQKITNKFCHILLLSMESNSVSQTNKYCRVSHCRFAWSHLTSAHLCGQCKNFGHGEIECGDQSLIDDLKNESNNEILPQNLQCKMRGCSFKWSHQSGAHHCGLCLKNHSSYDCPLAGGNIPGDQSSQGGGQSSSEGDDIFMPQVPVAGVDFSIPLSHLVKMSSQGDKGEYSSPMQIECPICRETNVIAANQKKVYGVNDKCVVCMEAPCEIFLPKCGHVCLCHSCGNQLNKNPQIASSNSSNQFQLHQGLYRLAQMKMGDTQGPIYIVISASMGCSWYIRRSSVNGTLEGFFMHSDDWGQYNSNATPQLQAFLNGYTKKDIQQ